MVHSLFGPTGKLLSLNPQVRESEQTLRASVDARFEFYLATLLRDATTESERRTLRTLQQITQARPLSTVLADAYPSENTPESALPLSAEALYQTLEKWLHFEDPFCDRWVITHETMRRDKVNGTPATHAAGRAFASAQFDSRMLNTIKRFFHTLREQMISESPEDEEKERHQKEQNELAHRRARIINEMIKWLAVEAVSPEERDLVVNSLSLWSESELEPERMTRFIEALEVIGQEGELFTALEEQFMEHYPECWVTEAARCRVRMVVLGTINQRYATVVPSDNFYFHPDDPTSEVPEEDRLFWREINQKMAPRERYDDLLGKKDGSVFSTKGGKLFWGDLLPEDIVSLRGTYYVLTQTDSHHKVPKAVRWDEGSMSPDYVRLMAVGKIAGGIFIKNARLDE